MLLHDGDDDDDEIFHETEQKWGSEHNKRRNDDVCGVYHEFIIVEWAFVIMNFFSSPSGGWEKKFSSSHEPTESLVAQS